MRLSGGLSCRRSLCRGIGRTSSRRGSSSSTRGRRWMPHHGGGRSGDFGRSGSAEFRSRPPGHGNQGWHLYSEESGHGFTRSRSNEKIIDDDFRPSDTRADGKYSRSGRENRGSFSQKDWKCHSRENGGSPNGPGRPLDDQRSVDGIITVNSHRHSDFVNTWDHYKSGGVNGLGTGQRFESENSLGSIDWKPLKWARSESMCSRGSGLSNSSSSKSLGVDSSKARAEAQMGCTPLQVMLLPLLHKLLPHLKKQVLRRSHVLVGVRGWLSMRRRRLMDLMILQPTMKQVIVVEPNLCSCKSKTWLVQALGLVDSQIVLPLLRPPRLLAAPHQDSEDEPADPSIIHEEPDDEAPSLDRRRYLPQDQKLDPLVASFSCGAVGVISSLMILGANNNIEQQ